MADYVFVTPDGRLFIEESPAGYYQCGDIIYGVSAYPGTINLEESIIECLGEL